VENKVFILAWRAKKSTVWSGLCSLFGNK